MKRWLLPLVALACLASLALAAGTATWRGTGDRKLDATLMTMNREAKADPDAFIKQLSERQGIPEEEIRQARETHGLEPADLYMASALAKASHRPVLAIAEDYKKNEGKGWGVMAKEMGIKPGSPEFRAMKAGAQGSLDHMKSAAKARQKHERDLQKEHEKKAKQESRGRGRGGNR